MTAPRGSTADADRLPRAPRRVVIEAAAALAAGLGVGRFVYTPILPLMTAHAGLSVSGGSTLATANYVGYLIGAAAGIAWPSLTRSVTALRASLLVVVATLALMPVTRSVTAWSVLRLLAGIASALLFMIAAAALLAQLSGHAAHLTGWAFGGVGVGIALSGAVVLVVRELAGWQATWLASAVLAAVLASAAWRLRPERATSTTAAAPRAASGSHRWFVAALVSYSLEGVGYIIAGTFLVAAIDENSARWVGSGAWILVGLAALPSAALWAGLAARFSRPVLMLSALLVQTVGIALPAVIDGVAAALASAVLFGATFLGIANLAIAIGAELGFPRAIAILTTGYSVGQIVGPLIVRPLLHSGYRPALLLGAVIVLSAAVAALWLRVGYPSGAPRRRRSLGAPAT